MTATSQRSAQRQQFRQTGRQALHRASQVGLAVVHSITPFASHEAQRAIEHNGTAKLNVRAHAIRALSRTLALVGLDLAASQTLRVLTRVLHDVSMLGRSAAAGLDPLIAADGLGGLRFAAALILGLFLAGAYGGGDQRRSAKSVLIGCALATLLPLWSRVWSDPVFVAIQVLFDTALLGAAVVCARRVLDAVVYEVVPAPLARAVLVGTADECQAFRATEIDGAAHGFALVGTVDTEGDEALSVEALRRQLVDERADTLLLCGQLDDERFASVVRAAMMAECRVLAMARRLALPGLSPKVVWRRGRPLMEMRAMTLRWQQLLLKRVLDIVLASVMLVCFAPLMALVAGAIALSSSGPVVYGQRRLGRYGRSFRCFKFRSMFTDAEQRLASDPALYAEYVANDFKLPEGQDPRITPLGRTIRRLSLDELPQLWNVIRGDMSLVGPRPIVPAEIRHYREDGQMLLLLQPGITGLWQVSGRSNLAYPERTDLELDYVERWSLGRDISILMRTLPAVLAQQGAH